VQGENLPALDTRRRRQKTVTIVRGFLSKWRAIPKKVGTSMLLK
jgi:hypothetical protein